MAEKRDYYEVLGIAKGASDDEIKKAYRAAAKKHHPDLNQGDASAEKKFKEVNEAYEVLSDPSKKQKYDSFGHAGVDPSYGGGGGYSYQNADVFSDIFGDFFGADIFGGGRSRRQNGPARGENIETRILLTFEEAAFGCKKTIKYSRMEVCQECGGSGAAKGTSAENCPTCHGSGQVSRQARTPFGTVQTSGTCPDCGGRGKVIKNPCKICLTRGRIARERTLDVNIPIGIDDGQTVSLNGQGNAGQRGGPAGDLYITISIKPHSLFTRESSNLFLNLPLTFSQAAIGGELDIPTLEKTTVKMNIPEGIQNGATLKLKGKGIPNLNGRGRGDMLITIIVEVPKHLSAKQKELLKQFDSLSCKNYEKNSAFTEKVKKM